MPCYGAKFRNLSPGDDYFTGVDHPIEGREVQE